MWPAQPARCLRPIGGSYHEPGLARSQRRNKSMVTRSGIPAEPRGKFDVIVVALVLAVVACLIVGVVAGNLISSYIALGLAVIGIVVVGRTLGPRRLLRRLLESAPGEADLSADAQMDAAGLGDAMQIQEQRKPIAAKEDVASALVEGDAGPSTEEVTDPSKDATVQPSESAPSDERDAPERPERVHPDAEPVLGQATAQSTSTNHSSLTTGTGDGQASTPPANRAADDTSGTTEAKGGASASGPVDLVLIIPGRKRFHREDCSLLGGHASEEITIVEAQEEGFTPCSVCIPDRLAIG